MISLVFKVCLIYVSCIHYIESIKSEGAINRQMQDKFNDILEQFSREIVTTRQIFDANMSNPPATRNQPPVAGAIAWSRSLFSRVRKTMTRFQADADEEMKTEAAAAECLRKYSALAKSVMQFEKAWFRGWAENVDSMAMYHLKVGLYKFNSLDPYSLKAPGFNHRAYEAKP